MQCLGESKNGHTSLLESVDERRREKKRKRIFLKGAFTAFGFISDSPPIRTYPAQTQLMPTHPNGLEWAGASHSSAGLSCSEGDIIMVFKVKKMSTSFSNSPPHNPSDYRVPERWRCTSVSRKPSPNERREPCEERITISALVFAVAAQYSSLTLPVVNAKSYHLRLC